MYLFVYEKIGQVHVCDDTCREAVLDPTNELLVCTMSGHCFDRLLSPAEMEPDTGNDMHRTEAFPQSIGASAQCCNCTFCLLLLKRISGSKVDDKWINSWEKWIKSSRTRRAPSPTFLTSSRS